MAREGTPVRLLSAICVPEEETCLYLCQADSVDTVQEAAARAGLHVHHITQAARAGPVPSDLEPVRTVRRRRPYSSAMPIRYGVA